MSREVAILGGERHDASVHHLAVPDELNLTQARARHREWLQSIYYPQLQAGMKPRYVSFVTWLLEREHCWKSDKVEEFWEDE